MVAFGPNDVTDSITPLPYSFVSPKLIVLSGVKSAAEVFSVFTNTTGSTGCKWAGFLQ